VADRNRHPVVVMVTVATAGYSKIPSNHANDSDHKLHGRTLEMKTMATGARKHTLVRVSGLLQQHVKSRAS
jgi:hypothetical protein